MSMTSTSARSFWAAFTGSSRSLLSACSSVQMPAVSWHLPGDQAGQHQQQAGRRGGQPGVPATAVGRLRPLPRLQKIDPMPAALGFVVHHPQEGGKAAAAVGQTAACFGGQSGAVQRIEGLDLQPQLVPQDDPATGPVPPRRPAASPPRRPDRQAGSERRPACGGSPPPAPRPGRARATARNEAAAPDRRPPHSSPPLPRTTRPSAGSGRRRRTGCRTKRLRRDAGPDSSAASPEPHRPAGPRPRRRARRPPPARELAAGRPTATGRNPAASPHPGT